MKKIRWITLFVILFFGNSLVAEIVQIEIRWNAFKCLDVCIPRVVENLKAIPQVSNIQTDAQSGSAVMQWNPGYPFTYEPFRLASSSAGIRFEEIILHVRGTISHTLDNFYLNSAGDRTPYLLVGPNQPTLGHHLSRFNRNPVNRPLTEEVKKQLLETEQEGSEVVVSGPLFFPKLQTPLTLVAEKIQILSKDNQMAAPNNQQK
jgi:hypothetical protein